VNVRYDTAKKTGAFSRISPDILDHMKALYVQMTDLYLIFQFVKGNCHGNQIMLRKCYQRRLIPIAFVALVLENELQYHGLAVRINSGDDGAIHRLKICWTFVIPEVTGLICERQVQHGQKTGVFCQISPDILEVFSQYLRANDGFVPYFPIYQGTLP